MMSDREVLLLCARTCRDAQRTLAQAFVDQKGIPQDTKLDIAQNLKFVAGRLEAIAGSPGKEAFR